MELKAILQTSSDEVVAFDTFLDAWNMHFAFAGHLDDNQTLMAERALASQGRAADLVSVTPQVQQMLSDFPNPSFIVNSKGRVMGQNVAAMDEFAIGPGEPIDKLPYAIDSGEDISSAVSRIAKPGNQRPAIEFLSALNLDGDRSAALAVLSGKTADGQTSSLVFVIDQRFSRELLGVISGAYGLTDAESEILMAFLSGASHQKIADERGTSLATVRTQFQRVLLKSGTTTQAELMRNALILAAFYQRYQTLAGVASHPYRKSTGMIRPGGRNVEVTLCGDMNGHLVVFIPDITLNTFPADMEAAFAQAGLCVATLNRPGIGKSDPVPISEHIEALQGDLKTLLGQLERETCSLMANSTSSCYAYRLGGVVADYIDKIILLRPLPPAPYIDATVTGSPWAAALFHGAKKAPRLLGSLVGAGLRAWRMMGTDRFVSLQLRDHKPDVEMARRPEVLKEFDAAFRATVAHGNDVAHLDLVNTTRDWSNWIHECTVPVTWFQGAYEPIGQFAKFAGFAEKFTTPHRHVSIPDGGYMAILTHTSALIEELMSGPGH